MPIPATGDIMARPWQPKGFRASDDFLSPGKLQRLRIQLSMMCANFQIARPQLRDELQSRIDLATQGLDSGDHPGFNFTSNSKLAYPDGHVDGDESVGLVSSLTD
eukprot:CAMPEP_0185779978 /NCGR_PEP_ID=MMETSP1174-20130828/97595_1 /TAXON_ID=35687 /ORGANISM="Dictyocha speculum, Strain CCMP1381" /LENGTH=104 /DNA_ID=CAMNT_0028469331 /DNA_START=20 /DNA_END=334 /DNA_ORIENTATION=-